MPPETHAHDKDALVHRIGSLLVGDPVLADGDWDGFALIVRYGQGEIARRISGFRYRDPDRFEAATPASDNLTGALDALRDATRTGDAPAWDACVFRVRRATGKLHVEFEYDHPERWDIGPDTLADVVERARPR